MILFYMIRKILNMIEHELPTITPRHHERDLNVVLSNCLGKFTLLLALLTYCLGSTAWSGEYLDLDPPGVMPKLFAPDLLKEYGRYLQAIDVSSDLKKYYLQVTDSNWAKGEILELSVGNDGVVSVQKLTGSKDSVYSKRSGEPSIHIDGDLLYFASRGDIFSMERDETGWHNPMKLGSSINKPGWREGCPTVSDKGTLYFHSLVDDPYKNAIYYSRFVEGSFTPRHRIDVLSQVGDAGDPGIAPDESYIVFASSRPGGKGYTDLYISFSDKGTWTTPQHLGDAINSVDWELGPKISPDGKYMFFYRRDKFGSANYSRIYWVSTAAFKKND